MGFLDGKVSQDDLERRHDIVNHSQFEDGFGESSGGGFGDDDDDIFGDMNMDDLFGSDGDSGFGGSSSGFGGDSFGSSGSGFGNSGGGFGNNSGFGGDSFGGGFGNSGFGSSGFGNSGFGGGFGNNGFGNNGFGNNGFGNNGFGNNGFGNNGAGAQQMQAPKEDLMDKLMATGADTAKDVGSILMELIKSLKDRNANDFGYLSRNMIIVGLILICASIFVGIIGSITGIKFISFSGISMQSFLSGGLSLFFGIGGIGVAALVLTRLGEANIGAIEDIEDIPSGDDNFTAEYEDNLGDELDDLFGDDFDALFNDTDDDNDFNSEPEEPEDKFVPSVEDDPEDDYDWDTRLDEIGENKLMTRETLFNTFKPMFPTCTPNFSDTEKKDSNSSEFATLETICLKALANIANCELEEVRSNLVSAEESFFSYTLLLRRFNKVKNCDQLASEIEIYLREDSDDDSVNATVSLVGDNYKIVVTKGVSAVVSFGDVFKQNSICEYFLDTKNKLPMITGIDELGRVIVEDAKIFDTMLICGKPRSGKSWYVLSVLMCLMLFNIPEDVQFIIVDPKQSPLFKTVSLLPHVCGLHDHHNIIELLDEIIEVEAPRRKSIQDAHKADDIWDLRKKGIQMPILYIVIDEYISVINSLDKDKKKEFDSKFQTIISQLPSLGIRLLFVPHRSTSIVDKTNRTMLQFTAAVRSDVDDVNDALGIKNWKRSLTRQGDIAVKSSSMKNAKYVRGAALTASDENNSKFIEMAAKAFYKMGVDIPDMSNLHLCCNRNEKVIFERLGSDSTRIQYDASTILKDLDNLELSDI